MTFAARLASLLALAAIVAGSAAAKGIPPRYLHALQDAAVPLPSEVSKHLWAVSDANARLEWRDPGTRRELAAAIVMRDDSYASYYASGSGKTPAVRPVVWVSLAPQLRGWCRKLGLTGARLTRRIEQKLGLPPWGAYTKVVEIWIDRGRLFRPCPDPGTADTSCDLALTGTPKVVGVPDYPSFFASLYVDAYSANGAPWTRLGYTYDWGGRSEVGLSEFMLAPETEYTVRSASSIAEYCS